MIFVVPMLLVIVGFTQMNILLYRYRDLCADRRGRIKFILTFFAITLLCCVQFLTLLFFGIFVHEKTFGILMVQKFLNYMLDVPIIVIVCWSHRAEYSQVEDIVHEERIIQHFEGRKTLTKKEVQSLNSLIENGSKALNQMSSTRLTTAGSQF